MTTKLSKEQSDALRNCPELEAVDPATGRVYVIVDKALFAKALAKETHEAIQRGIDSMEAGGGQPLDVAMNELRDEFRNSQEQPR